MRSAAEPTNGRRGAIHGRRAGAQRSSRDWRGGLERSGARRGRAGGLERISIEIHNMRHWEKATMAAQASMLHVRVDDKLKTAAAEKLAKFGLTVSDAVRILLTRVAKEGALPAGLAADPKAYDEWFRAKVLEALADTRPAVPHEQAMRDAQALIDRKRRARA
jgi:DNA-damage-inducible protein J